LVRATNARAAEDLRFRAAAKTSRRSSGDRFRPATRGEEVAAADSFGAGADAYVAVFRHIDKGEVLDDAQEQIIQEKVHCAITREEERRCHSLSQIFGGRGSTH
jgi:hypothetical protein